mmetsp:Transcript_8114/g.15497  ORF Transcript_8114/g.15497 Transcript_8114/m.15497 type:complete len:97 (-) Transcript_8114:67-357(-)
MESSHYVSGFLLGLAVGLWTHFWPCIWWTCDWGPNDGAGIRGGIWFTVWAIAGILCCTLGNGPAVEISTDTHTFYLGVDSAADGEKVVAALSHQPQ